MKSCIASHQRSESCASVITNRRRRILGQICSIGSAKIVRLNQQLMRPYRGVMKALGPSRRAANKRLERTRRGRASLLAGVGEPLKRNVGLLLVVFMGHSLLHRYWFDTKGKGHLGFGVTAYSVEDAKALVDDAA